MTAAIIQYCKHVHVVQPSRVARARCMHKAAQSASGLWSPVISGQDNWLENLTPGCSHKRARTAADSLTATVGSHTGTKLGPWLFKSMTAEYALKPIELLGTRVA